MDSGPMLYVIDGLGNRVSGYFRRFSDAAEYCKLLSRSKPSSAPYTVRCTKVIVVVADEQ